MFWQFLMSFSLSLRWPSDVSGSDSTAKEISRVSSGVASLTS